MYSLLHLLVFGDDRSDDALRAAEEGKAAAGSKPAATDEAELLGAQYCSKLVMCVVGLQASYLTWGVLQVCGYLPLHPGPFEDPGHEASVTCYSVSVPTFLCFLFYMQLEAE